MNQIEQKKRKQDLGIFYTPENVVNFMYEILKVLKERENNPCTDNEQRCANEKVTTNTTEYFCRDCKQLRLNLANSKKCGNCKSGNIIHGAAGSLDKDKLKGA